MEHYNAIIRTLAKGRDRYTPFLDVDVRHDEVPWELWVEGFERAMRLRPDSWARIADSGDETAAAALAGMTTLAEIAGDESDLERDVIDALTLEAPDLIPVWIETLDAWRREHCPAPPIAPIATRPAKVGRNDPCPCGSGRKYNRCDSALQPPINCCRFPSDSKCDHAPTCAVGKAGADAEDRFTVAPSLTSSFQKRTSIQVMPKDVHEFQRASDQKATAWTRPGRCFGGGHAPQQLPVSGPGRMKAGGHVNNRWPASRAADRVSAPPGGDIMVPFLFVAFASAPSPVVVTSLQTPQLVQQCQGVGTQLTTSFCTGYIMGAFDTLSISHQICPSATGASTPEAVAATREYLSAHPEKRSSAPAFLIRAALQAAFPCERPKKQDHRPSRALPSRRKAG